MEAAKTMDQNDEFESELASMKLAEEAQQQQMQAISKQNEQLTLENRQLKENCNLMKQNFNAEQERVKAELISQMEKYMQQQIQSAIDQQVQQQVQQRLKEILAQQEHFTLQNNSSLSQNIEQPSPQNNQQNSLLQQRSLMILQDQSLPANVVQQQQPMDQGSIIQPTQIVHTLQEHSPSSPTNNNLSVRSQVNSNVSASTQPAQSSHTPQTHSPPVSQEIPTSSLQTMQPSLTNHAAQQKDQRTPQREEYKPVLNMKRWSEWIDEPLRSKKPVRGQRGGNPEVRRFYKNKYSEKNQTLEAIVDLQYSMAKRIVQGKKEDGHYKPFGRRNYNNKRFQHN